MNKNFLILSVLLLLSISFAVSGTKMQNPYLGIKYQRVFCSVVNLVIPMNASAFGYNSSYNGQMNSLISAMPASIGRLNDYGCIGPGNVAAFNTEYSGTFSPLMSQVTAIYFRAAFDAIRDGYPPSWAEVWSQYQGFQNNMQACMNIPMPPPCHPV